MTSAAFGTVQPVPLGEILRHEGKLTEVDIARVVVMQRETNIRFGEAATRMGLVKHEDIEHALARQFDYPYLGNAESNLSSQLVMAHEPFSAEADAIRLLRGQLSLRWFDDSHKTLALVAPRHAAGTSVVAGNLALAFAQLGERTLLIDANWRRPSLHEIFGLSRPEGLSQLLGGRGHFKELLNAVPPFDNLSILCAGAPPPNPHELLSGIAFSYLLETAPAAFDAIIIDSPPLLEYPDAQVIATRAIGCLMVTRRHKTSLSDVELAKRRLEPTAAAIVGAVLNE